MTDIDNTETLRGKTLESIIQDIDNGQISEHCKSVAVSPTTKSVSFTNAPAQSADVVAYNEIYGGAVNSFVFDAVGLKHVSSDVDPYTRKTALVKQIVSTNMSPVNHSHENDAELFRKPCCDTNAHPQVRRGRSPALYKGELLQPIHTQYETQR